MYACNRFQPQQNEAAAPGGSSSASSAGGIYGALAGLWGRISATATSRRQIHFIQRYLAHQDGAQRVHACIYRMKVLVGSVRFRFRSPAGGQERGDDKPLVIAVEAASSGCGLLLPEDSFWVSWIDALVMGQEILSNSYILGYHVNNPTIARCLEHLQTQLAQLIEALSDPLSALPGASNLVHIRQQQNRKYQESAPADGSRAEAKTSTGNSLASSLPLVGTFYKLSWKLLGWFYPAHYATSGREAQGPERAIPAELDALSGIHGEEASRQLFYSLALLHVHRPVLESIMEETNRVRQAVTRAARQGLFDDGGETSTLMSTWNILRYSLLN